METINTGASSNSPAKLQSNDLLPRDAVWTKTLDSTGDLVLIVDLSHRILFINKAMSERIGRGLEECRGHDCKTIFHETTSVPAWCPVKKSQLPTESPQSIEVFEQQLGGYFALTRLPIFNEQDDIIGQLHIFHDINAQKSAEAELKSGQEINNAIIHNSPLGISIRNRYGRLLLYNASWKRIWAMPDEEVEEDLRKERTQLVFDNRDDYLGTFQEGIARVYSEGGICHAPELPTHRGRAGAAEWVSQLFYSIPGTDGLVESVVIITEDITERKKAADALRASEERNNAILNAMPDYIYRVDAAGTILDSREEMQALGVGRSADIVGKKIRQVFPGDLAKLLHDGIADSLQNRQSSIFDYETSQSGHKTYFEVRVMPISDREALALLRDTTDRRSLEEELAQAQKMEGIGQLAGGVAHDFNNILTAIIGFASLAERRVAQDSPVHGYLEHIAKAGEKASNLTRQLLAFARKQLIEPRLVDLDSLILNISKMLRRLIGEHIELVFVPSSRPGTVRVDPGQMEQVLINLAVNARDAMPDGGKLSIICARMRPDPALTALMPSITENAYMRVTITDTGQGIPPEIIDRVFEPFFTTKKQDKGTGLGLATCYGIIKQNGGTIRARNETGGGASFDIYLPCRDDADGNTSEDLNNSQESTGTETILLVEDDTLVRLLSSESLRERGYHVIEAENGEEGLRVARAYSGHIDLLLTDIVMPRMGGRELAETLRAERPDIRQIYCSGYTDDAIIHHGIAETGIPFLLKPFTPEDLVKKVRDTLDGKL